MEEVESFKYLGVWFAQKISGNVQLEKIVELAEERANKVEWMARVDGELGRARSITMGISSKAWNMQWRCGGKTVRKRSEAVQGRKLLGGSTMAGEAVHGEMGWRKLQERREEKKVVYG